MKKHEVLVIGTGVAGSSVAKTCRKAGMDVAVVDKEPLGGTCARKGCNPKKVLQGAAKAKHYTRIPGVSESTI